MFQWKMGNWSIELGGNVHTTSRNSALQVQAKLDRNELVWLQTMLGKRCLQAAAGYEGGQNEKLHIFIWLVPYTS